MEHRPYCVCYQTYSRLRQTTPVIESRLGRTVDGVLTLAIRGGLDDTNRNQAIQRIADVGGAVVRLETLVEMLGDQLTAGTLRAETEKRIQRQLATKLDASLLVDLDAPIGALLHAGVVGIERPTFRELHFVFLFLLVVCDMAPTLQNAIRAPYQHLSRD